MAPDGITIDFARPLPLFPLNACPLLPHASVPLHIFEARYRAMVRDALDDAGLIALALFEGEHWKRNYAGNPPIRPWVCVGHIARHHQLDDGRYNIILQGLTRARLRREAMPHPDGYRSGLLDPIESDADEDALDPLRARIECLLEDDELSGLSCVAAIGNWLCDDIPSSILIDVGALAVTQDLEARYALLSEPSAARRGELLIGHLHGLQRLVHRAQRHDPCCDENGCRSN